MKSVIGWTAGPLLLVGALWASGCGSGPVPHAKIASSQAAIRAAEETGSRNVPQAALHLKLAEEQLESAKKLIQNNEMERASYVLARAEADAELAVVLSRAERSKAKAGKALDDAGRVGNAPTP